MLKTTLLVVCAFGAGVGSTALWAKFEPRGQETRAAMSRMPSIEELHLKIGVQNLPDQTVKEPF